MSCQITSLMVGNPHDIKYILYDIYYKKSHKIMSLYSNISTMQNIPDFGTHGMPFGVFYREEETANLEHYVGGGDGDKETEEPKVVDEILHEKLLKKVTITLNQLNNKTKRKLKRE